jgi:hypothetical protein
MANITITIPDALIALYKEALVTRNAYIAGQGGNSLPSPTAILLAKHYKDFVKGVILSEAMRTNKTDAEVDALQAQLDGL